MHRKRQRKMTTEGAVGGYHTVETLMMKRDTSIAMLGKTQWDLQFF